MSSFIFFSMHEVFIILLKLFWEPNFLMFMYRDFKYFMCILAKQKFIQYIYITVLFILYNQSAFFFSKFISCNLLSRSEERITTIYYFDVTTFRFQIYEDWFFSIFIFILMFSYSWIIYIFNAANVQSKMLPNIFVMVSYHVYF